MTAGDYLVSDADLALARSPSQRYTLRVAFTPAYSPEVYQWTRPGGSGRDTTPWTPDASLGPSKVALVGQSVGYYFSAANRSGGFVGAGNQSIDWGDGTTVSSVSGVVSHTYSAAGLYEAKFTAHDTGSGVTFTAHRWVRVFATWASAFDGIAEVGGLSGSVSSGGWTASLKVTSLVGDYQTGTIRDGQGVILYAEQAWGVDDARGLSHALSSTRANGTDPHYNVLLFGYVVGSTLSADADAQSVTFQVRTPECWLQQMRVNEMRFLDSTEAGFGHVATGLQYSDVVNHLVYAHSNWGKWHSLYAWRESWPDANTYKSIVVNQGSLWQGISDAAADEFARVYCTHQGAAYVQPNVNARGFTWWGTVTDPPVIPFDSDNCLSIEVPETPPKFVAAYLEAQNPLKGTVLKAKYPVSPPDGGETFTQTDLTCEVQSNLTAWAERVYYWQNARYSVRLTTAMPFLVGLNALVVVEYADSLGRVDLTASVGGTGYRKPFYVESISYSLDAGQGLWQASYELAEVVRTRWNLTLHRWEVLNGETWEAA